MRHTYTELASAVAICSALALALAWTPPARGQNVAQAHEPAPLSGGPVQPITVEHQGRLLVLTYGPKPVAGALMSFADPRGEPPRFTVYQGQRQIASGQFEYG